MTTPLCRRCGDPLTPIYPGQTQHPLCSPTPTGWIPATATTRPQRPRQDAPLDEIPAETDDGPDGPLAAALTAAGRGWPVFPVRPDAKRPAFPNHTAKRCTGRDPRCTGGHQGWEARATTDAARIRRGWATTPYNIGLACGPAALVVIDLDVPKPGEEIPPAEWRDENVRTGADVLTVLANRARQPVTALYDTYTVRTGRGGRPVALDHVWATVHG